MSEEEFITDRVDNQYEWYNRKSGINKKYFIWFNGLIIFTGTMIPLVAAYSEMKEGKLGMVVAGMGVITAVLSGLSAHFKFQEKWTIYRVTAEAIMREKILYKTRTYPYSRRPDVFHLFVLNIERILDNENKGWSRMISSEETEGDPPSETPD